MKNSTIHLFSDTLISFSLSLFLFLNQVLLLDAEIQIFDLASRVNFLAGMNSGKNLSSVRFLTSHCAQSFILTTIFYLWNSIWSPIKIPSADTTENSISTFEKKIENFSLWWKTLWKLLILPLKNQALVITASKVCTETVSQQSSFSEF